MNKREERIVSHVVSLVLGIISIVTVFFWYLSIPSGIIAMVLGTKSYKSQGKKVGLAGLITGIVGVSLCVLIYIALIMLVIIQNKGY
jgi:hypothetical protein